MSYEKNKNYKFSGHTRKKPNLGERCIFHQFLRLHWISLIQLNFLKFHHLSRVLTPDTSEKDVSFYKSELIKKRIMNYIGRFTSISTIHLSGLDKRLLPEGWKSNKTRIDFNPSGLDKIIFRRAGKSNNDSSKFVHFLIDWMFEWSVGISQI